MAGFYNHYKFHVSKSNSNADEQMENNKFYDYQWETNFIFTISFLYLKKLSVIAPAAYSKESSIHLAKSTFRIRLAKNTIKQNF